MAQYSTRYKQRIIFKGHLSTVPFQLSPRPFQKPISRQCLFIPFWNMTSCSIDGLVWLCSFLINNASLNASRNASSNASRNASSNASRSVSIKDSSKMSAIQRKAWEWLNTGQALSYAILPFTPSSWLHGNSFVMWVINSQNVTLVLPLRKNEVTSG